MVRKQRKQLKWQQKAKQIKKQKQEQQEKKQQQLLKSKKQQQQQQPNDMVIKQKEQQLIQINQHQQHNKLGYLRCKYPEMQIVGVADQQREGLVIGGYQGLEMVSKQQNQMQSLHQPNYEDQIQANSNQQAVTQKISSRNQTNKSQEQHHQPCQQQYSQLRALITQLQKTNPIYQRTIQKQKIIQFMNSPYENILYSCGVTGSGKTTTIINIVKQMHISYLFVNCMVDSKVIQCVHKYLDCFAKNQIVNQQDDESGNQSQNAVVQPQVEQNPCIIIDQCDFFEDLTKLLLTIRNKQPKTKIILISNQNCSAKIQLLREPVITVFFMPYTQQQVINIVSSKVGRLIEIVPKKIVTEGLKKAGKKSGDFREIQKYLINWARTELKQSEPGVNSNNFHNFTDPFIQLLQKSILTSSRIKNNILLAALKSTKRQSQKNPTKKLTCKCKQNQIQKIISDHRSELSKNQCLLYLHEWQQAGLIKIQKTRCFLHNRKMDLGYVKMNINVDLQIIQDIIRSSYYKVD